MTLTHTHTHTHTHTRQSLNHRAFAHSPRFCAQARLALVRETLEVTSKPMIYDGDTGGKPEIFRFTVRMLENLGVS